MGNQLVCRARGKGVFLLVISYELLASLLLITPTVLPASASHFPILPGWFNRNRTNYLQSRRYCWRSFRCLDLLPKRLVRHIAQWDLCDHRGRARAPRWYRDLLASPSQPWWSTSTFSAPLINTCSEIKSPWSDSTWDNNTRFNCYKSQGTFRSSP